MARAPFQILVLPYRVADDGSVEYAVFRRTDLGWWQGIAGGGEDDETPIQAARRESYEEAGIPRESDFFKLDSQSTIPVVGVCGFAWGEDVLVIPQYCFGVRVDGVKLILSNEHTEYRWLPYDKAHKLLKWDNNRTALWELNHRITHRKTKKE
jgi:dATP pyrophosphohydrolase